MEGLEATTVSCQANLRRRVLPVVEPQDFQSCSGTEIQVGAVLSVSSAFRTYAVHQSSELCRSSELLRYLREHEKKLRIKFMRISELELFSQIRGGDSRRINYMIW